MENTGNEDTYFKIFFFFFNVTLILYLPAKKSKNELKGFRITNEGVAN